jgi:hypothetical protein
MRRCFQLNQTGAVVTHRDSGLVDVHVNATCLAAQVLVDRVPHDLEEQMLQGTRIGAADVIPGLSRTGSMPSRMRRPSVR